MLNKSVARRYAEAFFSIARDNQKVDEYQQELDMVVEAIDSIEGLKDYYDHLLIPAKEKKELTTKIFADKISQTTLNFICMIIDKRRESYIAFITEEYKQMADELRNILKAEMFSAQEVPADEVSNLAEKLSATTGKTVRLTQQVDPSLLGGVKLRVGDQVIDATVAKKLAMLKNQLVKAKIS